MEDTVWDNYGRASGNDKCRDCMVHCGYEPTAVDYTFGRGLLATIKAMMWSTYPDEDAAKVVAESEKEKGKSILKLHVLNADEKAA